jgi:hypothetical protein
VKRIEAIRKRGEVDFPEAGEGVILRFTNADLARIEDQFEGDYYNDFVDQAVNGRMKASTIVLLVSYGAKKDGKPYKVPDEILDDMAINDVGDLILDALSVAKRGKTFRELMEDFQAKLAEKGEAGADDENPPTALTTTSPTISVDEASEQG